MSGKKKTIIIVALLLVVFIGSISYALWSVTLEQTDSNIVKTGCFTVDMVEETDEINLPEEYPVKDEDGRKYSPFTFTIQNTCTIDSSYSVNLKVDSSSTLEHQYVKAVLDEDKAQVLTDYKKATNEDKYQLTTGTLAGASSEGAGDGESVTYNLRLWLDADTPKTQMSKDFYAKIVIENITTSGVVSREVLATGDISEAGDGSVTYTYYSTGEVEVAGTGRMSTEEGSTLASIIAEQVLSRDEFTSLLTDEELAVLNSENGQMAFMPIIQNYRFITDVNQISCPAEPTTLDLFKECLKSVGMTDENLYSLMDKVSENVPSISSINISEGITNISNNFFNAIKVNDLILPSTITEIENAAFQGADISSLVLNDGLKTLGNKAFEYSYISDINIPNTVTSIGGQIIDYVGLDVTIKLPKNTEFGSLDSYLFEHASNATIIVPDTITAIGSYVFAQAENITLNFECSEANVPSGVADLISSGKVVEVNYNYQID